jgi:Xaa-Pro aminopeptidase
MSTTTARVMAGIPASNSALYHALRFSVGDPVAYITVNGHATLILRDIEMQRAKKHARADTIACPADFQPESGLSGDRETATAQAAGEYLRRKGINSVVADRTLPLIFAELLRRQGIDVHCDLEMGVSQRRAKDEQEIEWLRKAQSVTEGAIRLACEMIANARANADGTLQTGGSELTSERVRSEVDIWLLRQGFVAMPSIIAGGPQGADCHDIGSGALRTGQPVIVDIFPKDRSTGYHGDCTRTVVHGEISDALTAMHAAVVDAKRNATAVARAGVSGEEVHLAAIAQIRAHGFQVGIPDDSEPDDYCGMVHGTGHGIGLDVHEPPLLDFKGPPLVVGDAITIEPGLYCKAIGGIRVEDMVVVRANECLSLNALPEGLAWR